MTSQVRVGVVGTGVIAQVMHLHYLAELADRYEVAAVCDLDAAGARACAERYGVPAVFADWRDLLGHPLDAVLVLTSGSHAPIAEAAARTGRHVFAEKPMCFSAAEGRAMVAAAGRAGVKLMTGYPKRYDPAFDRMREETARLAGARLLRVTTFESPLRPYIGHYPLLPRAPLPAEVELLAERGLGLAGAYVELPYSGPGALEGAVRELDAILDVFDTVRSYLTGPPPRPTLADSGSKRRAMLPARSVRDHSLGFDADGWRRFAAGLARVIARCRDRGYEPTFHPETGTHVEGWR